MNKEESFFKSVQYLFLSQILIKVLGLLYSLYLINKPNFGDIGNAIYLSSYQIFAFMLTFTSIGIPNAVSNLVAENDSIDYQNKVFKTAIYIYSFIACFISFGLFGLSDYIGSSIIGISSISYHLKILAPILIATALEGIYIGFFNGKKQMKITAKIQFIEQFLKCSLTIFFVEYISKKTSNSEFLSIGATLGVAFSILVSLIICVKEKNIMQNSFKRFTKSGIGYRHIIKKLLMFSVPISLGAMMVAVNKNIDLISIMNILAGKIGKENAKKIYGIMASKVDVLIALPLAFNITFSTALIPNISKFKSNNDILSIEKNVIRAIYMSLIIGIGSSIMLYFFSSEIFNLLFKNSNDGSELLKISAISIYFGVMSQTFIGILQGFQKNKIPVIALVIGTVVKFIFNIILVNSDFFLEKGVIVSSIISNLVMFFILQFCVGKNIKFRYKKYVVFIFFSAVVMVMLISKLNILSEKFISFEKIRFVICCAFGGLVYLFLNYIVGKKDNIFK